tara:strand:- start:2435 stop:2842 length:408 start_codon:yes stop_codon:yes gene_type:complete
MEKTYLGKKGYTIYKDEITLKQEKFIREELMVKAYIPKSPIQPQAFPLYRECISKMYMPRYFGIEHFGNFKENRLPIGEDINVNFKGELRDYQNNIVDKYINAVKNSGGGLLDVDPGKGKTVMGLNIISKLKKKH